MLFLINLLYFTIFMRFQTHGLPADLNYMPTLANGHLGYTVFGNAIYMNGIYNGQGGNSHRARIPNFLNFSISVERENQLDFVVDRLIAEEAQQQLYQLNTSAGYFAWRQTFADVGLLVEQRTYPHRYYNRALIYELFIERMENSTEEPLILKLKQQPGNQSDDFDFTHFNLNEMMRRNITSLPLKFKALKGVTKLVENYEFQSKPKTIFLIFSDDFEEMKTFKIAAAQKSLHYRYMMTVDEVLEVAHTEMIDVLNLAADELLERHSVEWQKFWNDFNITVEGNEDLSQTINMGIYYLANSLPSPNTNQPKHNYFGLSPTGLGRGELNSDYLGHNFWDTEIWMLPVVTQMNTEWAHALLKYRMLRLKAAQYNANITGYKGARFPWESAYTGVEVTNPCCPEVAEQQIHISPDIVFALEQYYASTTQDNKWLCTEAWPLVHEIAKYLESRVEYDAQMRKFHVKDVMGPDEDHQHVDDNVYTNVVFKKALQFSSFTHAQCAAAGLHHQQWLNIAENLIILYNATLDFHPQHFGYPIGEQIKQADVILLGYPLQYAMNATTRLNDLKFYRNVTRASGPAMTWSMFATNYLDLNEIDKANNYFIQGYKDYVRPEFKVWSETKIGVQGSVNFLTGIGGFLQAIVNGYAGIRVQRTDTNAIMQIKHSYLLPNTTALTIKGIKFGNAKFTLEIKRNNFATLTCLDVGDINMELLKGQIKYQIYKGFKVDIFAENVYIKAIKHQEQL